MLSADMVDVVVVGAGPAGLAAAATAGAHGVEVLLLDEQADPGGQIWRNAERVREAGANLPAAVRHSYRGALPAIDRLRRPEVTHVPGATVFDVSPELGLSWLRREPGAADGRGGPAAHRIVETTARLLIVATGAIERPLPFPGWTLPGVMGVGGLQTALKQGRLVPNADELVVAGQGPLLLLYLAQLEALGGRAKAVLDLGRPGSFGSAVRLLAQAIPGDPRLLTQGLALLVRRVLARTPLHRGVTGLEAVGEHNLEGIRFDQDGRRHDLECALLAVHDGVIANPQMTQLLGLEHRWQAAHRAFEPVTDAYGLASDPRVWVAGDGGGIEGAELATVRGQLAGLQVAHRLGRLTTEDFERATRPLLARRARRRRARRFVDALYPPLPLDAHLTEDTLVCRCEAVSAGAIGAAVAAGAVGPNRVKTFTRCGMGACQGRMCGPTLTRLVARLTDRPPAEVGSLRVRPPLKPILLADFVAPEAVI